MQLMEKLTTIRTEALFEYPIRLKTNLLMRKALLLELQQAKYILLAFAKASGG
jgi:hypothetical protein